MQNPGNKPIKYISYARKSSEDKERQVASIGDQEEVLSVIAKKAGLDVVDTLNEAQSAKKPGRPKFNEMVNRIYNGEANGILCWKLDRLARNPRDAGTISAMLQDGVLQVIKTNEREYYPTDNILMLTLELGMANQYIRDLSSNVKRGLAKKVRDGWYPSKAPVGYLNKTHDDGSRTIINDPERFELVRRVWDIALTGNFTVPQIWDKARNELALTTQVRRKSGGKLITRSAMYSVLTNPFYYGVMRYPEKSGEIHPANHKAMITVQEFDRVQEIIGTRAAARPKREVFAFTGLMKCGNCGCAITAESKVKKQKNGNIHYYTYYHCTHKKVNFKCDESAVEVKDLEIMFAEKLSELKISDDFKDWAIKHLHEIRTTEADSNKISMNTASKELQRVSDQIRELTLNYTSVENSDRLIMTQAEYLDFKNDLLKKKESAESRVSSTSKELESWMELSEKTFNLAYYASVWFENGTDEERKAIMSCLGSNLTIKDKKVQVYLHPFLETFIQNKNAITTEMAKVRTSENSMNSRLIGQNDTQLSTVLRDLDSNQDETLQRRLSYH